MKMCKCGSQTFIADVLSGDQEVRINEDGEIIECDTTVYEVGIFKCVECGRDTEETK